MSNPVCNYCEKNDAHAAYAYEITALPESVLYLFREQSHPGRLIVAHKDHVADLMDLDDARRDAYFADVAKAAKALKKAFNPDKINYAAYGDLVPHLHFHLVPKYRDQFEWGGTFAMNPQEKVLSDAECEAVAEKIRAAL